MKEAILKQGFEIRAIHHLVHIEIPEILREKREAIEIKRDAMADDVVNVLEEILSDIPESEYSKAYEYMHRTYAEKKHNSWAFPQQFLNIAIINFFEFQESFVALPSNPVVEKFFIDEIKIRLGITLSIMTQGEAGRLIIANEKKKISGMPFYFQKRWNFYRLSF